MWLYTDKVTGQATGEATITYTCMSDQVLIFLAYSLLVGREISKDIFDAGACPGHIQQSGVPREDYHS